MAKVSGEKKGNGGENMVNRKMMEPGHNQFVNHLKGGTERGMIQVGGTVGNKKNL